ncbi:MAG: efflux RND transporter periplasmic adaptor subunit [Paenirhodobacter sp.]|uniref:efflux RND transporter periplasmic adaptor subunit n=1 Tax=Paenirhodobacter sp. TaxID=1965326 RepID=UPI003D0E4F85
MTTPGEVIRRLLMVAAPAALGVAAVLYAGELKQPPDGSAKVPQAAPVRVITLAPVDLVPQVRGYGTVVPVHEWKAVARVEGEIVEIARPLGAGDLVRAGTPLFRIDDTDLKLDLANIDAQLAASKVKDATVEDSLALARSDLALAQADLKRQEQLAGQKVVTQSALETSRRQELTARTKVTELQSQITLNAAERDVLVTQRASLERAIALAEIRAPFDLRVTSLDADLGQYVARGQSLMSGEGLAAVDISAQFPIGRIGPLLRLAGEGAAVTDLKAKVMMTEPEKTVSWAAQVERMGEAIDERTQSAPVVVRVTEPLAQSKAGERPPLRRNMFVEVVLSAPKRAALVVPFEAVQSGTALVVSAEGTLEKRPVTTSFVSGDLAVVAKGLAAGDVLVITDPTIAVPGMAVKPVEDEARKAQIAAEALGGSGSGAAKTGAGKSGAGKSDATKTDATKTDATKTDAAKADGAAPAPTKTGTGTGNGSGAGKGTTP